MDGVNTNMESICDPLDECHRLVWLLIGLLLLCAVVLVLCCAGCLCQLFCGGRRRTRERQNTTFAQTEVLALFSNPRLPESAQRTLGLRPLSFGLDLKHLLRALPRDALAIEPAATLLDAQSALARHRPRLLVFSGHTISGALAFETPEGRLEFADGAFFAELMDSARWTESGRLPELVKRASLHPSGGADEPSSPTSRGRQAAAQAQHVTALVEGALSRIECVLLNGCQTEEVARQLLNAAPQLSAVVCWPTLAEDSAARAFGAGFYACVAQKLEEEAARASEVAEAGGCWPRRRGRAQVEGSWVEAAFAAGCASFTEQGFVFGDPAAYLHEPGHPHLRRPRFGTCEGCAPPVHGRVCMLRADADADGGVSITWASADTGEAERLRASLVGSLGSAALRFVTRARGGSMGEAVRPRPEPLLTGGRGRRGSSEAPASAGLPRTFGRQRSRTEAPRPRAEERGEP